MLLISNIQTGKWICLTEMFLPVCAIDFLSAQIGTFGSSSVDSFELNIF